MKYWYWYVRGIQNIYKIKEKRKNTIKTLDILGH